MTQRAPDIIGRYAQLSVAADAYAAKGQHPPEHIVREMQQIYTTAEARLTPQQMQAALGHVAQAKMRVQAIEHEVNTRRLNENARVATERTVREMTHGMFGQPGGISQAQLFAYINGKPIPAEGRRRPTPQELEAAFRSATRANDPKGVGWGKKETERRLDELADASPEEFQAIVQREGYRKDPRELQKAARQWAGERIEQGLLERRQERDRQRGLQAPKTREPNERDKRRATIVHNYLESTADELESASHEGRVSDESYELADKFTPKETEGTDRRAALARAWNEQQSEDEV